MGQCRDAALESVKVGLVLCWLRSTRALGDERRPYLKSGELEDDSVDEAQKLIDPFARARALAVAPRAGMPSHQTGNWKISRSQRASLAVPACRLSRLASKTDLKLLRSDTGRGRLARDRWRGNSPSPCSLNSGSPHRRRSSHCEEWTRPRRGRSPPGRRFPQLRCRRTTGIPDPPSSRPCRRESRPGWPPAPAASGTWRACSRVGVRHEGAAAHRW